MVGTGGEGGVTFMNPTGGTTSNYLLNGSKAIFDLPPEDTVVYADLVLAGLTINASGSFTFKTPTATTTLPYGTNSSGTWDAYHQDVTSLVSAGGTGTYEVDGVNGSVSSLGWYLYVVFVSSSYPLKYIYYSL
ncbi:hypothetical protein [Romboutsia sp.]|uniref:hypothetical protein n=1 Tax=Romboutsia sp. TaxID=1965302 RepID=UPI003F3B74EF